MTRAMRAVHIPKERESWDDGIQSIDRIKIDKKVQIQHIVNKSPFKQLISERDYITKKMFFRNNGGKDFWLLESAIPNEIHQPEKGRERLEIVSTVAKTNIQEI